jgi:serine/threonine-protein kinase
MTQIRQTSAPTSARVRPLSDTIDSRPETAETLQPLDNWQPVELISRGELALVYRARPADGPDDASGGYALKQLAPDRETDDDALGLWRREALVGKLVTDPNLIPILASHLREPPYYLVMPWLEGHTLEQQPSACGASLARSLWIARQVAQALDALHRAQWMHADVKPRNIHLSPEGHVTLLDLGFARRVGEAHWSLSRSVTGTPQYMAPEMITSALRPDIRSDIYSLGVVLYEQLSGRRPFCATALEALAREHQQAEAPNLRHLLPELDPKVAHLVHQMLSKQPLRRPQTPLELIDRLVELEIETFADRLG